MSSSFVVTVDLLTLGHCRLHWSPGRGLKRLEWLADSIDTSALLQPPRASLESALNELIDQLGHYARGEPADFSRVPLDTSEIPDFHKKVYHALRKLGRGETCSYGELASRAQRPGAARAVGQAMARNPFPIVVPCHRVLSGGGRVGGFSAPGGVDTKLRLLKLEGAFLS